MPVDALTQSLRLWSIVDDRLSLEARRRARDEHHHEELRNPVTLAQASVLFAGLGCLPLIPGAEPLLGTPFRETAVYALLMLAAMWGTFSVHRALGWSSRAYRVADTVETALFANGAAVLVGLGGRVASVWWLPYFALCVVQASSAGKTLRDGVLLGLAPLSAVAVLLAAHGPALPVAAGCLAVGGLAMMTWNIAATASDRALEGEAEREAMRSRIAELELAQERARAAEERRRIAMELHDGIGANLTAARLMTQLARRERAPGAPDPLAALEDTLQDGLTDLRLALWSLDPEEPSWEAILSRLRRHCADVCGAAGVALEVVLDADASAPTQPVVSLAVVRLVQEALSNSVRHAGARRWWLRVGVDACGVTVTVEDDGVGISDIAPGEGRGLGNMRQRVAALGGAISIDRRGERGTRIVATIPLASKAVA